MGLIKWEWTFLSSVTQKMRDPGFACHLGSHVSVLYFSRRMEYSIKFVSTHHDELLDCVKREYLFAVDPQC